MSGQQEETDKFEALYNLQDEYFAIVKRPLEVIAKPIVIKTIEEHINECTEIMTCEIGRQNKRLIHHMVMDLHILLIIDEITAEIASLINRIMEMKDGTDLEEITLKLLKCKDLIPGIAFQDLNSKVWEWRDIKVFEEFPIN